MITDQKVNKSIVGAYLIDGSLEGTQLAVTRKPNFLRKIFLRVFFGWKWASLKDLKRKK